MESKKEASRTETITMEDGTVLWNANPECEHELDPHCYSGVRCLHCDGWFCY